MSQNLDMQDVKNKLVEYKKTLEEMREAMESGKDFKALNEKMNAQLAELDKLMK